MSVHQPRGSLISTRCKDVKIVHKYTDGEGGFFYKGTPSPLCTDGGMSQIRQFYDTQAKRAIDDIENGYVLPQEIYGDLKDILSMARVVLQYTPIVYVVGKSYYVSFYQNTRELTFIEKLKYKWFNIVPKYPAAAVTHYVYKALGIELRNPNFAE